MHSKDRSSLIGMSGLAFLVLLVGRATMAGGDPHVARRVPAGLNSLMIGCNQLGAIVYLLNTGGGRLERIPCSAHPILDISPSGEKYDSVIILRLGSQSQDTWASGKAYLYFRDGYLAYKCYVLDDKDLSPQEVFQREIESGLQHPPNYPGLMDKVHWGEARQVRRSDHPQEGEEGPKVRCGIAFEGLPPALKEKDPDYGYVLALYQNVGKIPLEDNIVLRGFPVCAAVNINLSRETPEGGVSTGPIGIFGVWGSEKITVEFDGEKTTETAAPFRLRPGETTFMWFAIPRSQLRDFETMQARFAFLTGVKRNNTMSSLDAYSPELPIPKKLGGNRHEKGNKDDSD